MTKLSEILTKAYAYSKNHKFLWFFGFFLTGGGIFNFARSMNFESEHWSRRFSRWFLFLQHHPFHLIAAVVIAVVLIIMLFLLSALARAAITNATVILERKEAITFGTVIKKSKKSVVRVALISLLIDLLMLLVFVWLFVPIYFLFDRGFIFRGGLLAVAALGIFLPLLIIVSMVNIFASCFVVIFNMHLFDAIKSSFDLLSRAWGQAISLLVVLFLIYVLFFLFSASILSLFGVLAYGLLILLKSLSTHFPIMLYNGIGGLIFVLLSLVFIVVNAALNVFSNTSWTLLFLQIVNAKPVSEESKSLVSPAPAPQDV